jgi:hypothetical protein
MNAGTCWGKNTIDPGGRSVEKAPGSDFNFNVFLKQKDSFNISVFIFYILSGFMHSTRKK